MQLAEAVPRSQFLADLIHSTDLTQPGYFATCRCIFLQEVVIMETHTPFKMKDIPPEDKAFYVEMAAGAAIAAAIVLLL